MMMCGMPDFRSTRTAVRPSPSTDADLTGPPAQIRAAGLSLPGAFCPLWLAPATKLSASRAGWTMTTPCLRSVLVSQPQMVAVVEPQVLGQPERLGEAADRGRLHVVLAAAREQEHGGACCQKAEAQE